MSSSASDGGGEAVEVLADLLRGADGGVLGHGRQLASARARRGTPRSRRRCNAAALAAGDERARPVAVGDPALGLGLVAVLGGEHVHARDDVRLGELLGGLELLPVRGDRLVQGVRREVGRERVRQAEAGGELRAEERGAEEVQRAPRLRRAARPAPRRSGMRRGGSPGVRARPAGRSRPRSGRGAGAQLGRSVPGARPRPRSIRPGNSVSRVPNCSAITSGEWLGSMMPPAPSRMVSVCSATWPMRMLVALEAMVGMLWCSAYQTRR